MIKTKYPIEYGEGLKRETARSIDGILANARGRVARDAISVCSTERGSFVALKNVAESGAIDDSDRNTAFVHKRDVPSVGIALLFAYAHARDCDKIRYQGILSFPADETLRVVRAIIDASRHEGPLQYFDRIIGFKDYKLN